MRYASRAAAAFLLVQAAMCQGVEPLLAEAQRRVHSASVRYRGALQTFNDTSQSSEKSWIFERLGSRGRSKILVRFLSPEEVQGVAVLILNQRDGPSGQWLWTPASGRVRRIAALEVQLYGGEFSFGDLEVPDLSQFTGKLLASTSLDGAACWKIELRPKPGNPSPYTYCYLWLRKDNYFIAEVENYSGNTLVRRVTSRGLRKVQGIWTPRTIEVSQPGRHLRILFRLDEAEYNVPLDEAAFTLPGGLPTATQAGAAPARCAYMVQPQSATVPAGGSTGLILVFTQYGCTWTASAGAAWITMLAGSGAGPTGAVSFRVAPNTTPLVRTTAITVGDRSITIQQPAGAN